MFLSFKLPTSDKLYVNWYQYDDIDEFDALDVIGRLSDIWYPVAEDLEIMDITSRWIVTIEHDGVVVLLRW
ncbi:MAG: hypothetical protein JWM32_348 [Verrucomicrobia bacterium]|nr:hypothetical protein [Verrucomicrobiota bacterium]